MTGLFKINYCVLSSIRTGVVNTALPKTWVCGGSLAGVAGSNPA
jgi:hypothetical protein